MKMIHHKYAELLPVRGIPQGHGTMAVIGKNPAVVDASNRALGRIGAAALRLRLEPLVFNLFAARGTPSELGALMRTDWNAAVGEHNDYELEEAQHVDLVVAAWGQPSGLDRSLYARRVAEVVEITGADRLVCFGLTSDGFPLHPLHWRRAARIQDFDPRQGA